MPHRVFSFQFLTALALVFCCAPLRGQSTGLDNIRHIVFMLQENRSFDNYYGTMGQYRAQRGYTDPFDGVPLTVSLPDVSGDPISPYHFRTVCTETLSPAWSESHYDWDNGAMDNFMRTSLSTPSNIDPDGTRAMGYYDWTDLPYYYELAFQFATSDRWFSPVMSNTPPNRRYMFYATSFGYTFARADTNPPPPSGPSIFDRLSAAGVSWRYYMIDPPSGRSTSMYFPSPGPLQSDNYTDISQYFTDLQNESTTPAVMFIESGSQRGLDEHPNANIQSGAAYVKTLVDALMNSPAWDSSVFILSYDEGGGQYDHVSPVPMPQPDGIAPLDLGPDDIPGDFDQSGFRVPVTVVSPWVKPHFVSHTARDYTSILKLIETRFGLAPLTMRDAGADDMTEFFDSVSHPRPALPDQPTNGACDFSLENAPGH